MAEQTSLSGPGWLELYDLQLHSDIEAVSPQGYYVRGEIGGAAPFTPTSDVLGEAMYPRPDNAMPGWVELSTLATHRDIEQVAPISPFIHGAFDGEGHFYPDEPPVIE